MLFSKPQDGDGATALLDAVAAKDVRALAAGLLATVSTLRPRPASPRDSFRERSAAGDFWASSVCVKALRP